MSDGGTHRAGAGRIMAQQVAMLDRAVSIAPFNIINALVAILAIRGDVEGAFVELWFLALTLVVAVRLLARRFFLRMDDRRTAERLLWHVATALITGGLWGVASVALGDRLPMSHLMFFSFIIAGNAAGALAGMGPHLPTYFAYALSSLVPLALVYLGRAEPEAGAMALLIGLYGVVLVITARTYNAAIHATMRLRVRNERLLDDLKAAQGDLRSVTRSKWEALAHLSHELRTPMNAVLGFSEAMKSEIFGPVANPRYRNYADHIHESGRLALDLIESILETSRAEAGQLTLEEVELDPADMLEECVRMVAPAAIAKHITLARSAPPALPRVLGDRAKLRQIVLNLLTNAVKYTPAGGRISVTAAAAKGALVMAVADTGVGIAPEDMDRCLQPFGRLDDPLTRTQGGVGLGLALARRLTELHGGSLAIDSAPNSGTTVTVRLPPERSLAA